MLLHGIFPPITTPFYPDGNVYFRKLEQNVEQYSRGADCGHRGAGLDRRSHPAQR